MQPGDSEPASWPTRQSPANRVLTDNANQNIVEALALDPYRSPGSQHAGDHVVQKRLSGLDMLHCAGLEIAATYRADLDSETP
jgi:hypothetical protein